MARKGQNMRVAPDNDCQGKWVEVGKSLLIHSV